MSRGNLQEQGREDSRATATNGGLGGKVAYGLRILPACLWQGLTRRLPEGKVHLIIALADHFEPAIVPGDGMARAPYSEQEQRVERWCQEYPKAVERWRDHDGRPFVHTYFYPAEQYDRGLLERLADHCHGDSGHAGWGEVEVHLHHGIPHPDTAENLRRALTGFRDALALEHGCLSFADGDSTPRYAFVHGNFALANSMHGVACGVDEEMQVLSETGCFADMTLPPNPFHPAQTAKINSLYECKLPLGERASFRSGRDLSSGRAPETFPLMVQGPLMVAFDQGRRMRIENGSFTAKNPPSLRRLQLWKQAGISIQDRPDWLFVKLHCHSMEPHQHDAVLGDSFRDFLQSMVEGAEERGEILHFVSAREMVNIILAACDGREGNPGDYRDYRFKPWRQSATVAAGRVLQGERKP
jgi:hypothetical protein